ncbi:hypothetical protein BDV26DRAFT_187012 [Aspergillus bertholletiae]|uniref:Flavin-binding monooxygenase n=1 Tax=Aspergillus bertholletiae TaxID=1226010 RepID=A0A5N7BA85_9EURO|nr:hypothetical protein BDV26DRAFT_187012 [Aspergillus bertholletiae]
MFDKVRVDARVGNKDYANAAVVIIGAGISGMCMAIDLIKRNKCHNFVILEKSSGVGGTWHDNKYPGCCCDVWSTLYSYSFEQSSTWTREYPGQEEILNYLTCIAEKYGLYKHIRFNSEVEQAQWDDKEMKWKVNVKVSGNKDSEFGNHYTLSSDFLVSAVGQLNVPREPAIPGLRDFGGKLMHSARWDWTYDFAGKRVAVIGNGATAAQIVPEVAKVASHLTVYQRTPNWVIPRDDTDVTPFQQTLLTYAPGLRARKRALAMDFRESFHAAVTDPKSNFSQLVRALCAQRMQAQLPNNPELWEKLTPNYSPGCKRVIISDDYYPTLGRENVELETRRISHITETGIETEGGDVNEFDMIVLATGFNTVEFMHPIDVRGLKGRPLSDIWKGGANAYYGMTVEDLPNFAMFYGPNTNLGHNSIILMIEAQSRYINTLVQEVLQARQAGKSLALKPKLSVLQNFNRELQETLEKSSFADAHCNSWYKTDDGKITNNWSGTVVDYQIQLSQVCWSDYVADGTAKDVIEQKQTTYLGRVREESYLSNTSLLWTVGSALAIAGGYMLTRSRLRLL